MVIVIGRLALSGILVQYVRHCHLTLKVMVFITCNRCTYRLTFIYKQATFTPFAMHGIVGKVNINALLLQTVLYYKWGHAVMHDVIYRKKDVH